MKTIITTIAATLFAASASVSASGIYNDFGQGNPDLNASHYDGSSQIAASQPGVGSSFDRYRGWADGNPDLFDDRQGSTTVGHSSTVDVYRGFSGNQDL